MECFSGIMLLGIFATLMAILDELQNIRGKQSEEKHEAKNSL